MWISVWLRAEKSLSRQGTRKCYVGTRNRFAICAWHFSVGQVMVRKCHSSPSLFRCSSRFSARASFSHRSRAEGYVLARIVSCQAHGNIRVQNLYQLRISGCPTNFIRMSWTCVERILRRKSPELGVYTQDSSVRSSLPHRVPASIEFLAITNLSPTPFKPTREPWLRDSDL